MFYRHVKLNVNGEEVLYLYLTNAYEFGQDLRNTKKEESNTNISNRILNYLKNRAITFNGNKIYLVVDDIIVGSLTLKDIPQYEEIIKDYVPSYQKLKKGKKQDTAMIVLEKEDKSLQTMPLRDYLLGVLSSTILPTFPMESLKAQAIICRTYALKKMMEEHKIKGKNAFQIYHSMGYYKLLWGKDYSDYVERLTQAIDETKGQFLCYQDKLIEPVYHTVSNGRTEASDETEKHPFLSSVASIWDLDCPIFMKTYEKTLEEVASRLNVSKDEVKEITILELTNTNRVKKVQVGSKTFTGKELMFLLGLPSTDISFVLNDEKIKFITRGIGDGVGLSQYGASGMAKSGFHYIQILFHYFPNTSIRRFVLNNQ